MRAGGPHSVSAMKTLEEVIAESTDGAHAGEILVTQYQAEPIEDGDKPFNLEDAFNDEILAGLVDL